MKHYTIFSKKLFAYALSAAMVFTVSTMTAQAAEADSVQKVSSGDIILSPEEESKEEWAEKDSAESAESTSQAKLRYSEEPVASEIQFIDVNMEGRLFTTTASVGEAPYYQIFRVTIPENGGGYYTFYTSYIDGIDSYGYLCNADQYENLARRIEEATCRVSTSADECIISNDDGGQGYNFYINYVLEPNTTYYFIGTRYRNYEVGDYNLVFMRDIQIMLDNQGADQAGTENLYSKGDLWNSQSDREGTALSRIGVPEKDGYIFKGYYTSPNGEGTQVIDETGEFLGALGELAYDTTLYAGWEGDHVHTPSGEWLSDESEHWYACASNDGGKLNREAHTAGEWIVDKTPTVSETGSRHKECSVCGKLMVTEEIPAENLPFPEPQIMENPYFDFSASINEGILNAKNHTVEVTTDTWVSMTRSVITELAKRTDVSLTINYKYQEKYYTLTIPAGADLTVFTSDYVGFRSIDKIFPGSEIVK